MQIAAQNPLEALSIAVIFVIFRPGKIEEGIERKMFDFSNNLNEIKYNLNTDE